MEPIAITLRFKYRHTQPVKQQKSATGTSGNTKRHKLSQAAKLLLPKQPRVSFVVDGGTGHGRWLREAA